MAGLAPRFGRAVGGDERRVVEHDRDRVPRSVAKVDRLGLADERAGGEHGEQPLRPGPRGREVVDVGGLQLRRERLKDQAAFARRLRARRLLECGVERRVVPVAPGRQERRRRIGDRPVRRQLDAQHQVVGLRPIGDQEPRGRPSRGPADRAEARLQARRVREGSDRDLRPVRGVEGLAGEPARERGRQRGYRRGIGRPHVRLRVRQRDRRRRNRRQEPRSHRGEASASLPPRQPVRSGAGTGPGPSVLIAGPHTL